MGYIQRRAVYRVKYTVDELVFFDIVENSVVIFDKELNKNGCSCKVSSKGRCLQGLYYTFMECNLNYLGKIYKVRIGTSSNNDTFVIQLIDKISLSNDMIKMLRINFGYLDWYFLRNRVIFYNNIAPYKMDFSYLVNLLSSSLSAIPIHENNINVVKQSCK